MTIDFEIPAEEAAGDELDCSAMSDAELLKDAARLAGLSVASRPRRTKPKSDPKRPKPYRSLGDRHRRYRRADSMSSRHLDLHTVTGGNYGFEQKSDPEQLEVYRECKTPLDLPRDAEGFVIRSAEGQTQYCGDRCRKDRKNRIARNGRARASGTRVLSTYSPACGVPATQRNTGPQERFSTGQVMPWTVPCWAADPWLKFSVSGTVPIGRGRDLAYSDPVGDLACHLAAHPQQSNALDALDIEDTVKAVIAGRHPGLNIPIGK